MVKTAPPLRSIVGLDFPACDSTIRLQIDKPRPIPGGFVPMKGSKISFPVRRVIPGPYRRRGSSTLDAVCHVSLRIRSINFQPDRPRSARHRAALSSKFSRTWRIWPISAWIGSGWSTGNQNATGHLVVALAPKPGPDLAVRVRKSNVPRSISGAGEIEECFGRSLEPCDLLFEDGQSRPASTGGESLRRPAPGSSWPSADCAVRGDAGRHLPDGRQLLGPQRLVAALLHPLEHRADLFRNFVQDDFDLIQSGSR